MAAISVYGRTVFGVVKVNALGQFILGRTTQFRGTEKLALPRGIRAFDEDLSSIKFTTVVNIGFG